MNGLANGRRRGCSRFIRYENTLIMYAVIESGGKQYKVAVGDRLKVEKLPVQTGEKVCLDRVLLVRDGTGGVTVGSPLVETPVTATVTGHGKNRKIKVFKMKRRKNYRRTQGHRQDYTEIEITAIGETSGMIEPVSEADAESAREDVESPAADSDAGQEEGAGQAEPDQG